MLCHLVRDVRAIDTKVEMLLADKHHSQPGHEAIGKEGRLLMRNGWRGLDRALLEEKEHGECEADVLGVK